MSPESECRIFSAKLVQIRIYLLHPDWTQTDDMPLASKTRIRRAAGSQGLEGLLFWHIHTKPESLFRFVS